MRLNVLESFDEGEFVLAKKIKFVRSYLYDTRNPINFTHHTKIFDETLGDQGYRGQVGIFHGFGQCQDVFFETAL